MWWGKGFVALFTPETAKRVAKESVGLGLCGVVATTLFLHSKHSFPARHHAHPRLARPKARHDEEHEEHSAVLPPHHPHQPPLELSR
jgi:hypothetical protein